MPHLAASPAPSARAAPDSSSRHQTHTTVAFGGKAALQAAKAGGKTSRLGQTPSAAHDAPSTCCWSISAVANPQAPINTCTAINRASQCPTPPQSPSAEPTLCTQPAALRLPRARAATPPTTPTAASTALSATAAAIDAAISDCLAEFFGCAADAPAAAACAVAAWPTLDLELSAEEALCVVQPPAPEAAPLALAPRARRPAALLSAAATGLRGLARKLASLCCLAQPAVAA